MGSVFSILQVLPLHQTAAKCNMNVARNQEIAGAPSGPFCNTFPCIRRQSSREKALQNQVFETGFPFFSAVPSTVPDCGQVQGRGRAPCNRQGLVGDQQHRDDPSILKL
jgi:hypothetical protein